MTTQYEPKFRRRLLAAIALLSFPSLACADDGAAHAEDATSSAEASAGSATSETSGETGEEAPKFSFFVTSMEAMLELSGSPDGFGGDLGGLEGADAICQTIAANQGFDDKQWRAFLSVTAGPEGTPINAIDRIGEGPWYDRNGRVIAEDLGGLLSTRPDGHPDAVSDLPNELGVPQEQFGNNHDVPTGSNAMGELFDPDPASTCQDWTSAEGPGSEKKVMGGHSWPALSGEGWIESHTLPGCSPGVALEVPPGSGEDEDCIGCGGGYGAIYCFATTP
jgi:hypothetical protein